MAAVELPLNDAYLSTLHERRNERKRLERLALLEENEEEEEGEMSSPPPAAAIKAAPTTSLATAAGIAGTQHARSGLEEIVVSDSSILTSCPTPLLRLLVLLGPLITHAAYLVRLVTWTAGAKQDSHSFLLVLAWWGVCLYGYEVLRYAPQLLLLAYVAFAGLKEAVRSGGGKASSSSATRKRVITANDLNVILADLAELADFASTLSTFLVLPFVSLITWRTRNNANTRRFVVFLLTTWPVWLALFTPNVWDALSLPRVAVVVGRNVTSTSKGILTSAYPYVRQAYGRFETWLAYRISFQTAARLLPLKQNAMYAADWYRQHIYPALLPLGRILDVPLLYPRARAAGLRTVQVFPPWPLFSLTLRHALLVTGTLALTWCAPWAALIRHALWRSATVRRATLACVRTLCGQPRRAFGKGRVGATAFGVHDEADEDVFGLVVPATSSTKVDTTTGEKKEDAERANVTRHEDVEYQFTIYENQRWWVGLDWTAALLPQERPAWSDESNNPVSPPSSFSLPPARITLRAAPTRANPQAYTRRLVKWQWLDAEWSVAGRDAFPGSTSTSGLSAADEASAGRSGYIGDALGRLRGAARRTSVSSSDVDASSSPAARRLSSTTANAELPHDLAVLDVDVDGWQYGDNAWDKMSRKAGMGRYTRRRRWIRRAVLVELVERGYTPSKKEIEEAAKSGGAVELPATGASSGTTPSIKVNTDVPAPAAAENEKSSSSPIAALPSSPSGERGDLRQRLAKAAQSPTSGPVTIA